jgi:hypothetical protein
MKFAETYLFGVHIAPLSVRPPSRRARAFSTITEAPAQCAVFLTGRA